MLFRAFKISLIVVIPLAIVNTIKTALLVMLAPGADKFPFWEVVVSSYIIAAIIGLVIGMLWTIPSIISQGISLKILLFTLGAFLCTMGVVFLADTKHETFIRRTIDERRFEKYYLSAILQGDVEGLKKACKTKKINFDNEYQVTLPNEKKIEKNLLSLIADYAKDDEEKIPVAVDMLNVVKAANGEIPDDDYSALKRAALYGETNVVRVLLEADIYSNHQKTRALFSAIEHNYIDIVQLFLAAGADVNAKDNEGETALMTAASDGSTEIVRQLLAAGADVHAKDNRGKTALIFAVRDGSTEKVQQLLAAGADVNIADNAGQTALTIAKKNRYKEIEEQLLAAGVPINANNQKK